MAETFHSTWLVGGINFLQSVQLKCVIHQEHEQIPTVCLGNVKLSSQRLWWFLKWYHLTSLFKTGNLSEISQHTGPQIVVKVSYSCRDWNLIWEGPWMSCSGPQHTFLGTFKITKARKKTKNQLHWWQEGPSAPSGRWGWREAARGGHYLTDWEVQLLLPVLPDKAYLPHTHGSVYCSRLMTRG